MAPPSMDALTQFLNDTTTFLATLATDDTFTDGIQRSLHALLASLDGWFDTISMNNETDSQFTHEKRVLIDDLLQEIDGGLDMIRENKEDREAVLEFLEYAHDAADKLPLPELI